MAFAKALHHAAFELSRFLDNDEKRTLCTTGKTVQDACIPFIDDFDQPFATTVQWERCIQRLPRVISLRLYPNQIDSICVIQMEFLIHLNLTACGLASHDISKNLIAALTRASALRSLVLNDNHRLRTSGLAKLLRALAKSKASLHTLKAVNAGITRLPLVDKPLLARLQTLTLTRNRLSPNTIKLIFRHLTKLESAGFDIFHAELQPTLWHNSVGMLSWWRCSPEGIERLLSSPHIVCASLFCRFPGRWVWTPATPIGTNLRHISIGNVYMPPAAWTALLTTMATTATIAELRVWSTDTPHEALVAFVGNHRLPSHLKALAVAFNATFTEEHLVLLCQAMAARHITLSKWILKGCRRLRFVHSAPSFVATLRPGPVHLDFSTCHPVTLNRRSESQWFNHLFQHASFSYLDLSERSVILEDDIPPHHFREIEHLCLRSAEINWGLDMPMPRLRALCLASVQSRTHTHTDLFLQALSKPRLCNFSMDYCHLDDDDCITTVKAKHLASLRLDWVQGETFFPKFTDAIARGAFPSLSRLHMARVAPDVLCPLVVSLKGGQRHCCIDARSTHYSADDVQRLFASLAQVTPGDISCLRILVANSAKDIFKNLRSLFPSIAFETK